VESGVTRRVQPRSTSTAMVPHRKLTRNELFVLSRRAKKPAGRAAPPSSTFASVRPLHLDTTPLNMQLSNPTTRANLTPISTIRSIGFESDVPESGNK